MATIIRVDGTEELLQDISLATLQDAVGGHIEVVPTNDNRYIVLDEEGKLKGKPVNRRATELTRGVLGDTDLIVGNVVVAGKDEIA